MNPTAINPPSREPLEVADAKQHSRIWHDADDVYVAGLIATAREKFESDTRRSLITTGWQIVLRGFPCSGRPIELTRPPVQAVTALNYYDQDGNQQTLSDYRTELNREPGLIWPAAGAGWPATSSDRLDAVTVQFTSGYGDTPEDVPAAWQHALRLKLGHLYEHREAVAIGGGPVEVPQGYNDLVIMASWGDYH